MKRRHFLLLGAALLALIGCPNSTDNGDEDDETGPIKIAVAAPLTGSNAAFGEQIKMAVELKVEEINAKGGIKGRKVKAVFEDDRGDAAEAANVSRKLAGDKSISIVIGHFNSACSNAGKEEYNRKGVVQFTPGSTNVSVCEGNEWTFRNLYRDDYQGTFLARFASKVLKAKTAAVFYENDDYGKGLMNAFVEEADNLEMKVLKPISFIREKNLNFAPLIQGLKGEEYDIIFISGVYNEGALITKTARSKFGITVPILGGDGLMNQKFIEIAEEKNLKEVYISTPFLFDALKDEEDKKTAKAFFDAFKKKFDREPDTWAALTYDAMGMALQGIEEVGSNREKLKEWMASRTEKDKGYKGVTGITFFDEEGDCFSKVAHVASVKDGKFVASEKQLKE